MTTCKANRKNGSPCKAPAQVGRDYCFFHDPDQREANLKAKTKGGKTGKLAVLEPNQVKPWRGQPGEVEVLRNPSTADLTNLLADTIDEVRTGQVDPKVANSVGYLAGVLLKVLQHEAFEERLVAIEEAVGIRT